MDPAIGLKGTHHLMEVQDDEIPGKLIDRVVVIPSFHLESIHHFIEWTTGYQMNSSVMEKAFSVKACLRNRSGQSQEMKMTGCDIIFSF